jgi:predicted lysophospholipase L1 biosynthesis ABC-type transport system permease subunit
MRRRGSFEFRMSNIGMEREFVDAQTVPERLLSMLALFFAGGGEIARRVTVHIFSVVVLGAMTGIGTGLLSVRFIRSLLYEVPPTDLRMQLVPAAIIAAAALLAAIPPVLRALRIDPVAMLRAE